ncbi:hypothetical protein HYPSUDRAFT_216543 [Hypholoma sublateritium FD-334 SS-4]|uniref:Uncharacterized protein n=1 Tax=Hypholoma sublateritium (strain FD-334 SS-4) TaxID=945553 RepID=A0A0D2NXQ2_HYPSF|nr:hypothetical protein HYPSUDRAFT_216543 [Hypholoma sublateritium FD-334 SS-4]
MPNDRQSYNSLQATAIIIQAEMKRLPQLRKRFSDYNQKLFSIDLALVAHRIRTGYLLDLAAPKDAIETFSFLLNALRANRRTEDMFSRVLHIFEPSSEQSFFANAELLASRIKIVIPETETPSPRTIQPVFLHLGSPIRMLNSVPADLRYLLDTLFSLTSTRDSLPPSFSLPTDVTVQVAVPLAALLLDYPIAYVPSVSNPHALSGCPLDFYECVLISSAHECHSDAKSHAVQRKEHTIMKFSCPAQLQDMDPEHFQPASIVSQLNEVFSKRLGLVEDPTLGCDVIHTTQTHDHITF